MPFPKIAVNTSSAAVYHNKGYFADGAALSTAYPTGVAGDWSIVGSTDTIWVWDTTTPAWVNSGLISTFDGSNVVLVTTGFDGILSNADTNTQLAMNTIDDFGKIPTLEEDIIPVDFMEDGAVAPDASELYTNTLAKVRVRKFSGVANQDLYFNWPVPEKIDVSAGIRFAVEFIVSEATGPSSEKVSFTLAGYSVGNGDNTTNAFGGPLASNLGSTTAAQHTRFLTTKSGAITLTDLAASELAFMNLIRDAVGADDTYAQKVAVVGIRIYWSKLKS